MRLVLFVLLTLVPLTVFSQEYNVDLTPTYKKGDFFDYSIKTDVAQDNDVIIDGVSKNKSKFSFKAECEGKLSIVEIDPKSQAISVSLKIDAFKIYDAIGVSTILNKGDVIECSINSKGSKVFLLNGIECKKEDKNLVETLVSVQNDKMPTDQESFGPTKPVKVGEIWEINRTAALSALNEMGVKDKETVKLDGGFQLDKVGFYNKINCFFISGNLKMSGMIPPIPSGVKISESLITLKGTKVVPVIKGGVNPLETLEMSTKIIASGKVKKQDVEKEIAIKIFKTEKNEKRWTLVPKN